jgi:hypothetical protein
LQENILQEEEKGKEEVERTEAEVIRVLQMGFELGNFNPDELGRIANVKELTTEEIVGIFTMIEPGWKSGQDTNSTNLNYLIKEVKTRNTGLNMRDILGRTKGGTAIVDLMKKEQGFYSRV